MDSDRLRVVQILQAHQRLDEEGLRVLEVDVEEAHHGDAEVGAAELWRWRGCGLVLRVVLLSGKRG